MGRLDFLVEDLGLERQNAKIPISFAGKVNGYYTVVEINERSYADNTYKIQIGMASNEASNAEVKTLKEKITAEYKASVLNDVTSVFYVSGHMPMRSKKVQEEIQGIILTVTERLQELNIPTGDFLNGEIDDSISLYQIGNSYTFLSEQSYEQVTNQREEERNEPNKKKKTIQSGVGGAILGASIGAVVWGVLLYFGFYAWFAALIGTYLAFNFYQKNNGLLSIKGIVIVTGIVLLSLVLANVLAYGFVLYQVLADFGFTLSMIFLNFPALLQELGISTSFTLDLFLGIGSAAIFAGIYAYRLYNTSKDMDKI